MRGHMGVTMSLGEGSVFSSSTKQKLNTKSSMETELIAVDDAMPHILWTTYFLECQGYNVGKAHICQDNKSVISLEKWEMVQWEADQTHKCKAFFIKDSKVKGEVE
eukprot:2543812-Ditylum_brightwellii.AAC.1